MLLATKRDQEYRLAYFLAAVTREGEEMYSQQQALVAEVEGRTRESPLEPTPPSAGQVEDSFESQTRIKLELSPPDDFLLPPPEPKIIDSVGSLSS